MRCAVLCPGPSLPRFAEVQDQYETRIGINRAVMAFSCQWWVFADHAIYTDTRPPGLLTCFAPTTFVSQDVLDALGKRGLIGGGYEWVNWKSRYDFVSVQTGWRTFSVTAALVLAGSLGFKQIDCFGCDQTNAPDWDGGKPRGMYRTTQRWDDERRVWDRTTAELMDRHGVTVRRMNLGPA